MALTTFNLIQKPRLSLVNGSYSWEAKPVIKVYFGLGIGCHSRFSFIDHNEIEINILTLCRHSAPYSAVARSVIAEVKSIGQSRRLPIVFNRSYERIAMQVNKNISALSLEFSDAFNIVLAELVVACRDESYIDYDTPWQTTFSKSDKRHRVRFGCVEMRVIDSYLRCRDKLFSVLEDIFNAKDVPAQVHRDSRSMSFLSCDDIEWSLFRLMTNAGFYFSFDSIDAAKNDLTRWCNRYLSSMLRGHVVSAPIAFPFLFGCQVALWKSSAHAFSLCTYPTFDEIYSLFRGQSVFIVSPLADLINMQASSGNHLRLFNDYTIPDYELRALNAPVSIWPNRPSNGWTASFEKIRARIDAYISEHHPGVFVASCGCYGLPICDYVSEHYGLNVLYIGNAIHAFMGIRQSATNGFMLGRRNEAAWLDNNLGCYQNIQLIDGGRYV
ncbi:MULTISPECIES: hypothetical protein [Aphanothece]|uniref:hypothetical protein n=1 Tax=Aphanothece TaxID=1121 RepID=UPI0039856770